MELGTELDARKQDLEGNSASNLTVDKQTATHAGK